jgi:hypothetical protein
VADDTNGAKGFAGLSSLTSKIDTHQPAKREKHKKNQDGIGQPDSSRDAAPTSPTQPKQSTAPRQPNVSLPQKTSGSGWKWFAGIVVIVTAAMIYNQNHQNKSPSIPSTYTPPSTTLGAANKPTLQPTIAPKPTRSRTEPQISFQRPPVGRDNILSVAQIRWCMRENMRIDAIRTLIDASAEGASFNQMVDAYNIRCGSFKYRRGNLERAKAQVENLRFKIEGDARLEFFAALPADASSFGAKEKSSQIQIEKPGKATSQPPVKTTVPKLGSGKGGMSIKPTIPRVAETRPSNEMVREAQTLLKELGYDPGPIDGKTGTRTINAVKSFQRENWEKIDGQIDKNLIKALHDTRISRQSFKAKREGQRLKIEEAQAIVLLPDHNGKKRLSVSNRVPFDTENSCYGWRAKLDGAFESVSLREILSLPSKPSSPWPEITDGSRKVTPSLDGKSATTERTLVPKDGWVSNLWCIGKGDPLGKYSIKVFLNSEFVRVFKFEVLEQPLKKGNREKSSVPANAHIDYTGRNWECDRGYRPEGGKCIKVSMPANARIDYTGRNWECDRGYRPEGGKCIKVSMPANARIDYTGRNWECDRGYTQVGKTCVKI